MRKRALRIISGLGGVVAILAVTPSIGFAQEYTPDTQDILNNIWVFIAGVLVFFMQAGFALVEAGLTRAKNVVNIFAKNMADAIIGILAFFACGFAFAYGGDGDLIGDSMFFLSGRRRVRGFAAEGGLSVAPTFFFQAVFAATAVTIASGAMAERTKFSSYLVFSAIMCGFIYPVVVHWTWGGGIIAQIEIGDAVFSDFAGSGIVHMTGGIAALMGAGFFVGHASASTDRGREASCNPRTQHSVRHPRRVHPVARLVRVQPGFRTARRGLRGPTYCLNTMLAAAAGGLATTVVVWFEGRASRTSRSSATVSWPASLRSRPGAERSTTRCRLSPVQSAASSSCSPC